MVVVIPNGILVITDGVMLHTGNIYIKAILRA